MVLLAIPGLWRLGLDQAAWVALSLLVLAAAVRAPDRRLTILIVAFVAVVLLAGVLGASGYRWITFARELVIVVAFFAVIVGVSSLKSSSESLQPLIFGLAFVLAVSSAASLVAFFSQSLFKFETPVASLVPEAVAQTRLGELSFTDRSLGTSSYFLGHIFVRPHGLFLFSTSQAVAQAAAIPIFLAAARWYPRARWVLLLIAMVSAAALLTTTTRVPIVALPLSVAGIAMSRALVRGGLGWARRHVRAIAAAAAVAAIGVVMLAASGAGDAVVDMVSARSLGPRSALYVETIERWTQRPILGWGTEIDWVSAPSSDDAATLNADGDADPTQLPPLGSHSQYLGVLFKQGLLGFVIFIGIVAHLVGHSVRILRTDLPNATMLVAAFVATLLVAFTESIWLDPGAAVVIAVAWGLVTPSARGALPSPDAAPARLSRTEEFP